MHTILRCVVEQNVRACFHTETLPSVLPTKLPIILNSKITSPKLDDSWADQYTFVSWTLFINRTRKQWFVDDFNDLWNCHSANQHSSDVWLIKWLNKRRPWCSCCYLLGQRQNTLSKHYYSTKLSDALFEIQLLSSRGRCVSTGIIKMVYWNGGRRLFYYTNINRTLSLVSHGR